MNYELDSPKTEAELAKIHAGNIKIGINSKLLQRLEFISIKGKAKSGLKEYISHPKAKKSKSPTKK